MGKLSRKPGPDPKPVLDAVIIPSPLKRGGASGSPLKEITKEETKKTQEWMKTRRA